MISWSLETSWDDSPGLVMLAELPLWHWKLGLAGLPFLFALLQRDERAGEGKSWLQALHLSILSFTARPWCRFYCLHFTDESTEAQRGDLADATETKAVSGRARVWLLFLPWTNTAERLPALRMKPALRHWVLKVLHNPEILAAFPPKFPPLHTPLSHTFPGFQVFAW